MILALQAKCPHPAEEIFEVPYEGEYFVLRPFRVCTLCGLGEEGWGCGYFKLDTSKKVYEVKNRETAMSQVLKFYRQSDLNEIRFK